MWAGKNKDEAQTTPPPARLICLECRAISGADAPGWRAYIDFDGALGVYCPSCAKREFGAE